MFEIDETNTFRESINNRQHTRTNIENINPIVSLQGEPTTDVSEPTQNCIETKEGEPVGYDAKEELVFKENRVIEAEEEQDVASEREEEPDGI